MNNNYVDRDAEKLEMMGEIKQESRLSKMERHQHTEAYKGKNVENEEKRWKEEITFWEALIKTKREVVKDYKCDNLR